MNLEIKIEDSENEIIRKNKMLEEANDILKETEIKLEL